MGPLIGRVGRATAFVVWGTVLSAAVGAADTTRGAELALRFFGTAESAPPARDVEAILDLPAGSRVAGAPADTATVLALLVQFPVDNDPDTSGDGRFELDADDTYSINQPPHDHPYFDRQLRAGRNYFAAASRGRLEIEWTLFPPTSVLEMPNEMRYYNPDTTDAALNTRLAEFFRDAVEVADAADAPFSDHDYVMVFHAGVGQDLLIGDDTVSDIPSAFLSARELREFLDQPVTWPGIEVEGGAHHVREGFWLPETENQEGFEFALTGVFAQLMGAQLGLPILFNPDSGAPGVGRFGLMDQGGGNLDGRVPSFPTGWSRFDRGWVDAMVVRAGDDLAVRALGSTGGGVDVLIVPVDEREYFLIENRKKDVDENGSVALEAEATVPIRVVSDEYDFGIPGSGVLVWHVDQAVIDANRDENRVNADFRHRGVKLLEADGSDDIGVRPDGGFGLPEDAYFAGNNTALTPTSTPSTVSNYADAATGVFVTAVSDTGGVMTCSVANDLVLDGWPTDSGSGYAAVSPATGDLTGDGEIELVVADGTIVRVFDASGAIVSEVDVGSGGSLPPSASITDLIVADLTRSGSEEVLVADSIGRIRMYDGSLNEVAVVAAPGDGAVRMAVGRPYISLAGADNVVASRGDSVFVWDGSTGTRLAYSPNGEPIRYAAPLRWSPSVLNVVVITDTGAYFAYEIGDTETVLVTGRVTPPAVRPVFVPGPDLFETLMVVVSDDRTTLTSYLIESVPTSTDGRRGVFAPVLRWTVDGAVFGSPAVGDVNADGAADVVIGDGAEVRAINFSGYRVDGWPRSVDPFGEEVPFVSIEPLLVDLDGDERHEVLLSAPDGTLKVWRGDGTEFAGWPRVAGASHAVPAWVSDFGGGSVVQVVEGTRWIHAYAVPDLGVRSTWLGANGGKYRTGDFSRSLLLGFSTGADFLDEDAFVVYPNPASERAAFRFRVNTPSDVEIVIYDTTGSEISRVSAQGVAGITGEAYWDLRNNDGDPVAPGLYVAYLTASSPFNGESARLETKVAVVR